MNPTVSLASLALLMLTGCPDAKSSDDTGPIDTNVLDDTANDTSAECTTTIGSIEPADGATDVYYRDSMIVNFEGDGGSATLSLADSSGVPVPVTATFTSGNVQAIVVPDSPLTPLTGYQLSATVCDVDTTSTFTTSELGTPLDEDTLTLLGKTFSFRLSDSDITEPAFLNLIAGTYLTVPILLGVESVDSAQIHMIGGLGDDSGATIKQESLPTWDFPSADFTTQPFFHAESPLITIMYGDVPIPIADFNISGTFNRTGTTIEEGHATGIGDSRYMSELVGKPADDYGAVCDLAAAAGVVCTACADGEPYCLYIVAENIIASEVEGLTMAVIE